MTSAKTGMNVDMAFTQLIHMVAPPKIEKYLLNKQGDESEDTRETQKNNNLNVKGGQSCHKKGKK